MSCAEQRQKRWRKAPHGGSAFSALGNTALTSRLSSFFFSSLLIYSCVSLLIYCLSGITEISCSRIFTYVKCILSILHIYSPSHTLSFIFPLFISLSTFLTPFKGGRSAAERIQTVQSIEKYITAPNVVHNT